MRFPDRAVLGIIFLLAISFSAHRDIVHAQSVQIDTAQNQLSIAFAAVQQADEKGVSQIEVSLLASNLNRALNYLGNASALSTSDPSASSAYANQSVALSSSTLAEAQDLTTNARNQLFLNQVTAYSLALVAAFVMATFVVEFQRLRELVERIGIHRKKLD